MNPLTSRLARLTLVTVALCCAGTASAHNLIRAEGAVDCENDVIQVEFFANKLEPLAEGGQWSIEYNLEVQTNGALQTFSGSLRDNQSFFCEGTDRLPCKVGVDLVIDNIPLTGNVIVGGSAELWQAAPGEPEAELWDTRDISNEGGQSPFTTVCEEPEAALGDRVWEDLDGDGIQACTDTDGDGRIGGPGDTGAECDAGIANVEVTLFSNPDGDADCSNGDEQFEGTDFTDIDGFYDFTGLTPGVNYCVQFDRNSARDELQCDPIIGKAEFTAAGQGNDDALDSDANTATGRTESLTLADGEFNRDLDAGLYCPAKIGDMLTLDENRDGIQDPGEPGIDGQTVELIRCEGNVPGDVIDDTLTSGGGMYMFNPLPPGEYAVRFSAPGDTVFSPQGQGNDDTIDCDADMNGLTQCVTLGSNEYNDTIDACVNLPPAGLGDRLWEDKNANGIQDNGEPGIPGVPVRLLTPGNDGDCDTIGDNGFVDNTVTGDNGSYSFNELDAGEYCVEFAQPQDLCAFGAPQFTVRNAGDDADDSDVNPDNGITGVINLPPDSFDPTNDAGVFCPAKLGDQVWEDSNENGLQDNVPNDEQPVPGVVVNLLDCDGNPVTDLNGDSSVFTDNLGMYMFTVNPGSYLVEFELPGGQTFTTALVGNDPTIDSDANPVNGRSQCVTVPSNTNNDTIDAGLVPPRECGLAVNKQCTVITPPPTQPFTCDGKVDTLTMRYDGSLGPLGNVRAFAGDSGTTELPVNRNGDLVSVTGYQAADAPNDVVWLFNGVESTFHLSCSDDEMDGETDDPAFPNDCGRPEGDGKGNDAGVNAWTLEGLATDGGSVLQCSPPVPVLTESCSFRAEIATCDSLPDKPETLTFRYTGGGCAASDNDQKPDDATCAGSIDPTESITVSFGNTSITVAPQASFDVPRSDADEITLSNAGGTEFLELHTSCSQPLQTGDIYGSLTLAFLDGVGSGRDVLFSYELANNGTQAIGNISVVDNVLGPVANGLSLGIGETTRVEATGFVETTTTNVVTVSGDAAGVPVCEATDDLTVTVLPPPPCTVSVNFDKLEDDKIKWTVRNDGNRVATLDNFVLNFPAGYDAIKEIKLDGGVWKNQDSPLDGASGSLIGSDDWTEDDVSKRELDPGEERTLEIVFEEKVDKELYQDDISSFFSGGATFEEGCSIDL